jgi:hypothetical protein
LSDETAGCRDHDENVEKAREERQRRAPMPKPPKSCEKRPQAAQSPPKGKSSG